MKTREQYLSRFAHCPACDSQEIEGESVDIEGDIALQEVGCLKCNATWTDSYRLNGFNLLEKGDAVPQYNHLYTIAFTVVDVNKDGSQPLAQDIRDGLMRRLRLLDDDELVNEAIEYLDTYEEEQ